MNSELTLPLDEIDYNLEITDQDLERTTTFPPARFERRNERLRLYDRLWLGDVSDFVDDSINMRLGLPSRVSVPVPVFRNAVTSVTDLLLMSRPTASIEFGSLIDICGNGLTDMMRYGGVDIWAGEWPEYGPFVSRLRPHRAYRHEDGGYVLLFPFVSNEDNNDSAEYNRVELIRIYPDFETTSAVYEYSNYYIDKLIEEEEVIGTSYIFEAWRTPEGDGWGTSMFDDMISGAVEISKRYSSNSFYLDILGSPFLSVNIEDSNLEDKYREEIAQEAGVDPADYRMATDVQKQAGILKGLSRLMRFPIVDFSNSMTNAEFKGPGSGGIDDSFKQIEAFQKELDKVTGVIYLRDPSVLSNTSGVGLDRILLPLYSRTSRTQNELVDTLQRALSFAANQEVTIDWPHVVEVMQNMTSQQQQAQIEQMAGVVNNG